MLILRFWPNQEGVRDQHRLPAALEHDVRIVQEPPEAEEFEKAGLTPAPCEVVAVPGWRRRGASMECLLDRILPLGTDHLVIGRMVSFHVRDGLYENGRIDVAKLQ